MEPVGARKSGYGTRRLLFYVTPAAALLAVLAFSLFVAAPEEGPEVGDDLCPIEAHGADGAADIAVLLLDLRKPLDPAHESLPSALLRGVSLELRRSTELKVFALTGDSGAPRQLLGRVCKPYGNADLLVEGAKDQRSGLRDCDDLPAQLSASTRAAAEQFCARRRALRSRVDALAGQERSGPIGNAYLVEALEDTSLELAERPGRRTLYIFSDMMQHAEWYSHLDLDWTEWSFQKFTARRTGQNNRFGVRPPHPAKLRVEILYVPRHNLSEQPRRKRAHQAFWRNYFGDAEFALREQPAMSTYPAAQLMDLPNAEDMALERERLRQERAEAELLLRQIERERALLEEARRATAAEDGEGRAQEAEPSRQAMPAPAAAEAPPAASSDNDGA